MVSSKDHIDSASVADSGHGTTVSEEPQWVSRHIDSASVADSGRGPSIFSDPREDSLSLIDSKKATSTKEKLLKGKVNVRESVMHTCMHAFVQISRS